MDGGLEAVGGEGVGVFVVVGVVLGVGGVGG